MRLATKTAAVIEAALCEDQGAKYRGFLRELMPLAEDAYRTESEPWRKHLGASLIGRECAREIWYSFRWATKKNFDGRMLRLFNRGHLEEPRLVALLRAIGCEVWQIDSNGRQFRMHGYRGHFSGSLDGVARGIPDLPDEPVLTEYKTHNDKSFAKLREEGVLKAKWEHFVQMQMYMGAYKLSHALYAATNKNDDDLHLEVVQFDPVQYSRYEVRAAMIVDAPAPPPKINRDPTWFKCKFCDQAPVCHGKALPEVNCRTCEFVEIGDNGTWICKNGEMLASAEEQGWDDPIELDYAAQLKACQYYKMNPFIKGE